MAGETTKCEAICLRIVPWSRTSHIVTWLTPTGKVTTVVKGAVRSKSAFLGQYDLNYRCEIVYYLRATRELHALRDCAPVDGREALRGDYRKLLLAEHFRRLVFDQAPSGPDAGDWFDLLDGSLARLGQPCRRDSPRRVSGTDETPQHARGTIASTNLLAEMLAFELAVLRLAGLSPELEAESGAFALRGERKIPVTPQVARCLKSPLLIKYQDSLADALRVIGVFYAFHLEGAPDTRRTVLQMISTTEEGRGIRNG